MNTADITFVVITKNEAARLRDCLASVPSGAQALIYDSQSRDATASIARAAGAQVVDGPWRGFARTRLDAAGLVQTPWTFMLDADERLSAPLAGEIAALEVSPEIVAYSVARRNWFCGRWIRGAGWWPDRLVRLFRTGHATLIARGGGFDTTHEAWQPDGQVGSLTHPLEHDSYPALVDYRTKFERYTRIEAQAGRGDVQTLLKSASVMPARLLWLLLGRAAILDGWRGLVIAWYSALYPVVVAARARKQR